MLWTQRHKWQNIIWREWRYCEDQKFAKQLFDLVADEPAGWGMWVMVFLGMLYGALGGMLVALVRTNWDVLLELKKWETSWVTMGRFGWGGGLSGGIGGLLSWILVGQQLTGRTWLMWRASSERNNCAKLLKKLLPEPFEEDGFFFCFVCLYAVGMLIVGSSCLWGIYLQDGVPGIRGSLWEIFLITLFMFVGTNLVILLTRFGHLIGSVLPLATLFILGKAGLLIALPCAWIALVAVASEDREEDIKSLLKSVNSISLINFFIATLIGCIGGLLSISLMGVTGEKIGQHVSISLMSSWLVSICAGYPSAISGFAFGIVGGGLGATLGAVFSGISGAIVAGWMLTKGDTAPTVALALVLGIGEGLIMMLSYRGDDSNEGRPGLFWLRRRPHPFQIEQALQQACHERSSFHEGCGKFLHQLEIRKQQSASPTMLTEQLSDAAWEQRFLAGYALVLLGGEAVQPLYKLDKEISFYWLRSIAEDTTVRLKKSAFRLFCPDHLTHCGAHSVRLSKWRSATYYGCRTCGRSRGLLNWPRHIIAVLDQKMTHEQERQETTLRVNWLTRAELFDFDQIEILNATDEDVERFAVQVSNDTDEVRQPRYKTMRCVIAQDCQLSENTLRILRNLFQIVEIS